MKKVRRTILLLTCLVLLASLPIAAFAASKTFFTTNVSGHRCVGSGQINGGVATSALKATEIAGEPIQPGETYQAYVWLSAFTSSGDRIGSTTSKGHLKTSARYSYSDGNIAKTETVFTFSDTYIGTYDLYA